MTCAGVLGVALLLQAQDPLFESPDYGLRLKIPPGWNVESTRQARVILKLVRAGDAVVKPEILVYELVSADPLTLPQYKEQLRHYIQRSFKNPRMLDDRAAACGSRPGFVLAVSSKGVNDADLVSLKGVFEMSPRRLLGVDGTFPSGPQEEELGKAYAALLEAVEFVPRRAPLGLDAGMRQLERALETIVKTPSRPGRKEELEILMGDKTIGTYSVETGPASRNGAGGIEMDASTRIDVGEDGRVESRVRGFLSDDLAVQSVSTEELKTGKDKRVQSFSASVTLESGILKAERRINGERTVASFPVRPRTVLTEITDLLQLRLLDCEKGLVALPVVGAFDNEPGHVKIEHTGLNKMKDKDGAMNEVHVVFLQREEGTLVTYWYDPDRRLARASHGNQGLVFRPKKK